MKRFYTNVSVQPAGDAWQITLDDRPIKTQGGTLQLVPTLALAKAMAAEWDAQGEKLDTSAFVYRDLTDFAIDQVAADPASTLETLGKYAETDTLCYRADPGDALFARQEAEWEPILGRIEERENVRFTRVSGIMHAAQPEATLAHFRGSLAQMDAFALTGLQTLASLATSFAIGLEALQPGADAKALWDASSLEELWQEELWGTDAEATAQREAREADFMSAFKWMELARA
ncbi:MAG: ATP12 family protein [Marinomonas sp.]